MPENYDPVPTSTTAPGEPAANEVMIDVVQTKEDLSVIADWRDPGTSSWICESCDPAISGIPAGYPLEWMIDTKRLDAGIIPPCNMLKNPEPNPDFSKPDQLPFKFTGRRVQCSKLNPAECPKLGNVVASRVEVSTANKVYTTENPKSDFPGDRLISCFYDKAQVSADVVATEAYIDQKRKNTGDVNFFDDVIMSDMCKLQANWKKCPDISRSYVDGSGHSICNNMITSQKCKDWAQTAVGSGPADSIMGSWCANHTNPKFPLDKQKADPTCHCVNRIYDENFKKLQQNIKVDAGCWFGPCLDSPMRQYQVQSKDRHPTECPQNVCTIINDAQDNNQVDMTDISQYIECNRNVDPPDDGGGGGGNTDVGWWNSLSPNAKAGVVGGSAIASIVVLFTAVALIKMSK